VTRVLHLTGSVVDDFYADLSRLYAADCLAATADADLYEFHIAYLSPDGFWRFPVDLELATIATAPPWEIGEAITHISRLGIEVMVPHMFCRPGMTAYRALFDLLGIPYVGNTPDVMALGADKAKTRAVVAAAGVKVPPGQVLFVGNQLRLTPPVVVKPVDVDNSLGISLVRRQSEFDAAIADAFSHSDRVLVEQYIDLGREVRCGIVERDGVLIALPLEEYSVDRDHKPIRLHDDKIHRVAGGQLGLVAKDADHAWIVDVSDRLTAVVGEIAKTCHVALGARHYSLFDFRIDPEGRPWFLEAGLYCSFARQSVIAMMADAAGISLQELFHDAIQLALNTSLGYQTPASRLKTKLVAAIP
jgi:D-alanine-D-alanine ligase